MALAWSMTIWESTVFEKLFHEDQPMGGRGIGAGFAAPCALRPPNPHKMIVVSARRDAHSPGKLFRS